ncbi:MAG: S8 family peptidase, partial [Blautia sp.]|nr:S8 family peptidase [Blautia sp.]
LGQGALSQYVSSINGFAQNAVSIAAGNEGAARHHYGGRLEAGEGIETVELRVGEDTEGFTLEFWGETPEEYLVSLQSPIGEVLEVCASLGSGEQELTFVFVETRVLVNYVEVERQTGFTLIYFRFLNPAAGIWKFLVQGRGNRGAFFHMWLPVQGLIPSDTFFLASSPDTTITAPGDSADCITATAYRARDNSLYLEASRGYLPDGTVKPTLSLPGVEVKAAIPGGGYGIASGTSLAAAQNAGISALLFEWALLRNNEPYYNGNNVRYDLVRGAGRDENRPYPNAEWGYGRVDLYRTFELLGG